MFCIKCGEKLDEDSKFCIKCGAAVDTPVAPNTPVPVTPVQIKANTTQGIANQASYQDQSKTVEPPKNKNKLLSIAIIAAPAILAVFVILILINEGDLEAIFSCVGSLFILTIPTILNVLGQKKNSRNMILAAGIVYAITFVGIPSAIMCFIAYAKMKKA